MVAYAEILVVDDEPHILRAIERELRTKVARIHTATSAKAGLDLLDRTHIDLVITDYRMPVMNGADFLLAVNASYPEIPTIMLSGQADIVGVSAALNAGALNKYVNKPWDKDALFSTICSTLEQHKARSQRDKLTGCWSASELTRRFEQLDEHPQRPWLLVMLDIEDMSKINDQLSVVVGNQILSDCAAQLNAFQSIKWYRAADKFISLLEYSSDGHYLLKNIQVWVDNLARETELNFKVKLLLSEVSSWRNKSINQYNIAARKQKRREITDRMYWLEDSQEQRDVIELKDVISDIETARFEAFFQPQMNLVTQQIDGCEALVRRRLSDGGFQSPNLFMPLLTQHHLVDVVTVTVFEQVLSLVKSLREQNIKLKVSFNVTPKQLEKGFIYNLLLGYLDDYKACIAQVGIEMVETDKIEDFDAVRYELERLKSLGVTAALDDFGTGFSGFDSLCDLPFDAVKIDGRYVRSIGTNDNSRVILHSITQSAKTFNIDIVAEWVEEPNQIEYLKNQGCTHAQGYLISPPLCRLDFLNYLHDYQA
ncbi:EAL domain, c-di-GMP-specific phosphodiesterase class I (or its enzymatically inactive variant) [Vibrio xiamenensis]|uniref:EAL domain, c-di-GMP-specific phosphodiesterase class I (Or its enzymatically inactive variant) n=1 Tax=Vibrio xiamenensis TaxID=861298 RepID=A0A1G8AP38_9VIBR|nr:EAL domain-containing protein [Vibrio xiamenensis]SDH22643.1 EAL domain, c-di-GMP-specific phosphodiesterase class I (or its enzymatically inactive variant) [Vibrio xiamenensis]